MYLPLDTRDATRMAVLVRTDRPVGEMTQAMRAAIASADPEQAAHGFMTLGECAGLIGVGFFAGGVAGLWGAGWLRSLMYGISSTSPVTFVVAATVLGAAVLAGCYVPARRAARTDPALVLRGD